jgi:hypothetical protein
MNKVLGNDRNGTPVYEGDSIWVIGKTYTILDGELPKDCILHYRDEANRVIPVAYADQSSRIGVQNAVKVTIAVLKDFLRDSCDKPSHEATALAELLAAIDMCEPTVKPTDEAVEFITALKRAREVLKEGV